MLRDDKSFFELIVLMPWWVGVLFSIGSYIFIRFAVPSFFASGSPMLREGVSQAVPFLAGLFAFVFAGAALISAICEAIEKWKNNKR